MQIRRDASRLDKEVSLLFFMVKLNDKGCGINEFFMGISDFLHMRSCFCSKP